MPVADRLLLRRVPGHLGDRKVDLGQPPARSGNHDTTIAAAITGDSLFLLSSPFPSFYRRNGGML